MAKMRGLVGTISGRAGNQVFYKGKDGSTIMRAYQPQVKNPNSGAQVSVRAKFTLSTKLAAGLKTSGALLLRSYGYRPTDRGELVKRIYKVSRVLGSTLKPSDAMSDLTALRPLGDFMLTNPTVAVTTGSGLTATMQLPESARNTLGSLYSLVVIITPDPTDGQNIGTNVLSYQSVGIVTDDAAPTSVSVTISESVLASIFKGSAIAFGMMAIPSTGNVVAGQQSFVTNWGKISGGYTMPIEYLETGEFIFSNLAIGGTNFEV